VIGPQEIAGPPDKTVIGPQEIPGPPDKTVIGLQEFPGPPDKTFLSKRFRCDFYLIIFLIGINQPTEKFHRKNRNTC
jgi:hypothetical protein